MTVDCAKMAKLSGIAYLDGPEAKPLMKELGYTTHKFIEKDGAQCHIVSNKEEVVVVFRGTEPGEISDVLADLNAWPDKPMIGKGLVHNGFQEEVNKVWDPIQSTLNKMKREGKHFYVAGHSLGGAMATIFTSRMADQVSALFTYGSPRTGTRAFVKAFEHVPHFRHVNNNDIVTSVPLWIMGYRHHGKSTYINHYGFIRKFTPWQRFKDKMRGRWEALKKGKPFDGVGDHDINKYFKHTNKNQKKK